MASPELIDLRAKITRETDVVLSAETRISGRDRSELVREILDAWAKDRLHAFSVLANELHREGMGGSVQGMAGSTEGAPGSAGGTAGNSGEMRNTSRSKR